LVLRIAPAIYRDDELAYNTLISAGYKDNLAKLQYRTNVLNLTAPLDSIRKGLKQKWRNMLNQAERNKISIDSGTSDEYFCIFLDMQSEMLQRKKFNPGVDYEEFRQIQNRLSEKLKMNIFVASKNGNPNACLILSCIGNTGIYLLGASDMEGRKYRSAYLLQWRAIEYLKEQGCFFYDLGGIDPKTNPGVYDFKSGLGGEDRNQISPFEGCQNLQSQVLVKLAEIAKMSFKKYSNSGISKYIKEKF
jgi:lipid II:glycine glycyltransferase (peptidoglycan interpeptide bridge formation enzyme)